MIRSFLTVADKKNIVWLASYPKSGNTWLRTFLHALKHKGPVDLNKLGTGSIFSSKAVMENVLDLDPDLLNSHEIEKYQRLTYNYFSETSEEALFVKVHDAFTYSQWDGLPVIPVDASKLVVYIIRNPLDIVPSFSNHNGKDYQTIINRFLNADKGAMVKNSQSQTQFYQLMGNWSMHVESWTNQDRIPVHIMHYEEMNQHPFETFKLFTQAAGIQASDDEIKDALRRTEFSEIQKIEKKHGFKEKSRVASTFFLHGKVGRWKSELSLKQIKQVRFFHEKIMKRFGYWEDHIEE